MKKSITGVVLLLAGAFVAHSQGTVSMGNYTAFSAGSYMYVTLGVGGTKLGGASGASLGSPNADTGLGNQWTVALYGAAGQNDPSSSLLPLLDASAVPVTATLADGSSDAVAGTWYSGTGGIVPGTTGPASSATVQIYAWYNMGGTLTSYPMAVAANVPVGFSATGNVPSLGGGSPPLPPVNIPSGMGNIALTTTTPEPSTIALGVMGASAFLMRLRKKQ